MTTMRTIEYYDEDYEVLSIKEFREDYKFRTIKYGTGFYALQSYGGNINGDMEWKTMCISPKLDIGSLGYCVTPGGFDINWLLGCIEDNFNFRNKDYWELKVQVSEDDFNSLSEVIKREDGETLLKELFKLNRMQKLQLVKYYNDEWNWKWIFRINMIIWVIIVIFVFANLYLGWG